MMDETTITKLQTLTRANKETIQVYGNYHPMPMGATYNDKQGHYDIKERTSAFNVSNVSSLVAFVKEDLTRRENPEGNFASMTFTQEGGKFSPDDNFNTKERGCHFQRELSQQWKTLSGIVGKTLNHEDFLLALQSLKQSIATFNKIYNKFARIRIIGRSQMVSNPVFIDGESENGYVIKHNMSSNSKEEEDFLPAGFAVELPYAKGSDKRYFFDVETLFVNNKNNQIEVRIVCPEFEQIEEKAILDEVSFFKEQLKDAGKLLILESY